MELTGNIQHESKTEDSDSKESSLRPNKFLSFHVSFEVNERVLLKDAFANMKSGECMAIMGPSGAGKTTLLNVLTFESKGGTSSGVVKLNNMDMSEKLFRKRCNMVTQDDHHWAFLTPRETLTYAARLYHIDVSDEQVESKVNTLLRSTGLEVCADVRVGNALVKGLSGGQKRRLSVAMAILKDLDVLYLDEPTSGLDSASAAAIMTFLSDIAKSHNIIIITTIHQPSTAVYNGFDRVMILSRGQMAYCGKAGDEALAYFESIGHAIPPNTNPAEFIVDMVNGDFNDQKVVDEILKAWYDRHKHDKAILKLPHDVTAVTSSSPALRKQCNHGFLQQLKVLLQRHSVLAYRDPLLYTGRMVVFLLATLFFALVYIEARSLKQDQVLSRMWFALWCIGMPANMAVVAVFGYNLEFFAIKREVKNGMVTPGAFLLASFLIQLPMMVLFGIFGTAAGAYGVLEFVPSHYLQFLVVYALLMYSFEAIAQVFSVMFLNPLLGMLTFIQTWFASFLFCGLMVPVNSVVWPLRVFAFITPLKFSLRSVIYQEFIDQNWKGASLCDPLNDANCFQVDQETGPEDGFTCGDISTGGVCFGKEGWQVLSTLSKTFTFIETEDMLTTDLAILVLISVSLKLVHAFLMIKKCNNSMKLEKSKTENRLSPSTFSSPSPSLSPFPSPSSSSLDMEI